MLARREIGGLLICLVLALGWRDAAAQQLPKGILRVESGPAPALVLDSLDGERWDIAGARGHWLFVHFWASWCGPCRREMPTIQALSEALDPGILEIVLVNTAETEDMVFAFLASAAPDLDPLLDSDGMVTERWQPRGLPATFLVDPAGRIRYIALGGRPWDTAPYLEFLRRITAE